MPRYENCGTTPLVIDGKTIDPGGQFTHRFPEDQELSLLRARAIRVVKRTKKKDD